jgi:hypothetical protein
MKSPHTICPYAYTRLAKCTSLISVHRFAKRVEGGRKMSLTSLSFLYHDRIETLRGI